MAIKRKLIALISTDILTPYKANEVFCVPEEDAAKLLTVDRSKNEYGVPRYPKVKARLFDVEKDGEALLAAGSLNLDDHNRLLSRLHPDRPAIQVRMTQYESEITNLLEEIDPERVKEYASDASKKKTAKVGAKTDKSEDDSDDDDKAPRVSGPRVRQTTT